MRWLDVLHLLDSSFPTGAYVHSFGLEALAPTDLQAALTLRVEQGLARLELVFLRHAYSHDLLGLDQRLHALLLVRESREASALIGTQLLKSALDFLADARLERFMREARCHHHPITFGALTALLDLPADAAAEAYAFASLRGQVSAAQRLGWLGQRAAQRVLHELKPAVRAAAEASRKLTLDEAGAFAPAWDIACMAHERARVRMFAS
jgi:urease accessory protein